MAIFVYEPALSAEDQQDFLWVDQDVTVGSAPVFSVANFTDLPNSDVVQTNVVLKNADYLLQDTDHICVATSGSFSVTLPDAVGRLGKQFMVKNSGNGTILLASLGFALIDGEGVQTLYPWDSYTLVSNGVGWVIV